MSLLNVLLRRKDERLVRSMSAWQTLVADVECGTLKDPDAILERLETLQKTPEELDGAIASLQRRKADAAVAATESSAEKAVAKQAGLLEAFETEMESAIAQLEARRTELADAKLAAVTKLNLAIDARTRLLLSVPDATKRALLNPLQEQIAAAESELSECRKSIRDRQNWISQVESLEESAATSDQDELPGKRAGLKALKTQEAELVKSHETLVRQRDSVSLELLKPEAGI